MSKVGPLRLIVINSGVYDYAEVDLDRPGHLAGHNNAGKTSLISTLQFLYIANQRDWRFSKPLETTKKFYFRTDRSFIIFECRTPTGIKTVVVRGLGGLQSYGFERWVYEGPYESRDFIDGREVREPREVRLRLSDRGLRDLSAAEFRQALTGSSTRSDIPLIGLVPVRESQRQYEYFTRVFRHLIQLEKMTGAEFKELLIEINRDEIRTSAIDLSKRWAREYNALSAQGEGLKAFEHVRPQVERLIGQSESIGVLRGRIPVLNMAYMALYRERMAQLDEQIRTVQEQIEALDTGDKDARTEIQRYNAEMRDISSRIGGLSKELERIDAGHRRFDDFLPEFEKQAKNEMQRSLNAVMQQLAQIDLEPTDRVHARLQQERRDLEKERRLLGTVDKLLASSLVRHFRDEDLRLIFTLLSQELLRLDVTDGSLTAKHDDALIRQGRAILDRVRDGVYEDEAVRIELDRLDAPDLARFSDPEMIRNRINELEQCVARDQATLEAAERRDVLIRERDGFQSELGKRERELEDYAAHLNTLKEEPRVREQHERLNLQIEQFKERVGQVETRRDDIRKQRGDADEQRRRLVGQHEQLGTERRQIESLIDRRPDVRGWQPAKDAQPPDTLHECFEELQESLREEMRLSPRLHADLDDMRLSPYSTQYMGESDDEEETLAELREQRDAFDDKKRVVAEHWQGMAAHIAQEIKRLLDGLEALERRVIGLNRRLSHTPISNLKGLRIDVNEALQKVRPLKQLAARSEEQAALDFEAEGGDIASAQRRIGEMLSSRPYIRLSELFDVSFTVTLPNGAEQVYHEIEGVESNGTTITIKVVVFVLLLRGLMNPRLSVTIPFYIDEISSLDEVNAKVVVNLARSRDFIALLASPSEMAVADVLYFLQPGSEGRLVLGPEHRAELEYRNQGEEGGAEARADATYG